MRVAWPVVREDGRYYALPPDTPKGYTLYGNSSAATYPVGSCSTEEEAIEQAIEAMPYGAHFTVGDTIGYFNADGILVIKLSRPYVRYKSLRPPMLSKTGDVWVKVQCGKRIQNPTRRDCLTAAEKACWMMANPTIDASVLIAVAKSFRKPVWTTNWKAREEGRLPSGLAVPPIKPQYCEWAMAHERFTWEDGILTVWRDIQGVELTDRNGEVYKMGDYKLSLTVFTKGDWGVKLYATDNTLRAVGSSHIHPHASTENRLCTGDAGPIVTRSLAVGSYQGALDALEAVVRTYNPASPYNRLEHWLGRKCTKCGSRGHDTLFRCQGCNSECCQDCVTRCGCCGRRYCGTCNRTTTCNACERGVCLSCGIKCRCCEDVICPNCIVHPTPED